jgi:L-lactate dehydrogenase complex protein LldF
MESIYSDSFDQKSSQKALDRDHRKKINFNIGKYNATVPLGKQQFTDLMSARQQAKNIKPRLTRNIPIYETHCHHCLPKSRS